MHLRSLAFVSAALLVRVNAVSQNISFAPSSPQVQLLPSDAWTLISPADQLTPLYAYTDRDGAHAIFTFPQPGSNFFWKGYPSEIGQWGLCIDCKAAGTDPTDNFMVMVSGAKQVRPNAPATVLLSRWDLGLANHTITITNMVDGRFNVTGQLTLVAFEVTYEVFGPVTMPTDDQTPYSRGQLVLAVVGAITGTTILLVSIVYFLRKRSRSKYTPVQEDQDPAVAEFDLRRQEDNQVRLRLRPISHTTNPPRDTPGAPLAQYPSWSSAAASGRGRYPQIIVTSPTAPSASSLSTESHYGAYRNLYDPQHHFAPSTQEDTMHVVPLRPPSPIPNGNARFGYSPIGGSDEGEDDIPYNPNLRYDPPNTDRSLMHKIKHGILPAIPIRSPDPPRPSHTRTESRDPLIQTGVAAQSTRPPPEPELQLQSPSQLNIQPISKPIPDTPTTQPLAPTIVPPTFLPPSHAPSMLQVVGNIGKWPLDDPNRGNNQPPNAPRDKAHFSVQEPPTPTESVHFPSSPPAVPERETNASNPSVDHSASNPAANPAPPSTTYQVIPRPPKATDMSDRSQTWYSNADSFSSQSRQFSLDSPLPSSNAYSHGTHGDKKGGPARDSISPIKSDMSTPSTGDPTPSAWEFPLPPGAPLLQHTKSDPCQPVSVTRQPRPRTKSTLSKVVATAEDVEVENSGVVIPMVSESPARSITGSPRPPNGAVSKGSKGSLRTVESQVRTKKPITPGLPDEPEVEQKKLGPGSDMRGENVGRDVSLLSGIPMILAGSLNAGGASTDEHVDRPGKRTKNSTVPKMEGNAAHPESSVSHTSCLSDDEHDTLERAEIHTAELAIRSPPRNVPELARWDTIRQMSDPEEREYRSGSNATASGSTRKRKSPDLSPPPVPPLPATDVRKRLGESLDISSRATSMAEGQLVAIPMSLAPPFLTNRMSPVVPWTPSPATTPLRLDTLVHGASPQQSTFDPSDRPPWQPLRFHTPPRDEQRSPSTPPSVPPIPELAPISFENLIAQHSLIQDTVEKPGLVEEQTEAAVLTVHEASPRISSEVHWQPGHTPGSSIHSQGTTDTFGMNGTKSIRGVPKGRGPRPRPEPNRERSTSRASIASIILSHHTGSHATSGSGSQNDGYNPIVDYIVALPPPVAEQSEPDTASESHTTAPTTHNVSPKLTPVGLMTPISTSTKPFTQTDVETPFSSRASAVSTLSGITTRARAGSTRPSVGVVRGPRDRSSTKAVPAPSSSISRGYSINHTRSLSFPSPAGSYGRSPSLSPGNAAGSPNPKTDSMITTSNHSILDLYTQSPSPYSTPNPDALSLLPNGHPQSRPS